MSGWGMNAAPLYASGDRISGQGGDADASGRALLNVIADAEGVVHHPTLVGAFGRYYDAVSRPANQFGENVRALGCQIQTTASTGAGADLDATETLKSVGAAVLDAGSALRRSINVG
ncbi:MAG: hypothetical protein H0X54_11270 [Propionibacteriales bacterium]|nr:hypothetical protein [Actinomycetota bacterium]MBA3991594.1 hypothetical protein [Propionibacteriales bacterium]